MYESAGVAGAVYGAAGAAAAGLVGSGTLPYEVACAAYGSAGASPVAGAHALEAVGASKRVPSGLESRAISTK